MRFLKTFILLLLLCSLAFSQAILVHNGNGNILHSGLVLDYQFTEGTNQLVFNRAGTNLALPNPVNQYGAFSEQFLQQARGASTVWTAGAGVTVTDFFATDPNGNQNASRLVMTAGASRALYFTITTTATPYTVSFYVKSNTGSSQAVGLGRTGSPSVDKTVTTSWSRVEATFTPSAAGQTIGILNDAAQDALDILIYGAQLELGSPATAYILPTYNQQLGSLPVADANDPTWAATGLTYAADNLYTRSIGTTPLTFSSISFYAVFKKTGADSPGFFEPILTSESPYNIVIESRDSLNGVGSANETGPGFGFSASLSGNVLHAKDVSLNTSYHVFAGTYDGTNIKLFFDGTQVAQRTIAVTSKTVHRMFTSMFEGVNDGYFPGTIGMIDLYTIAHTTAQVRSNTNAMFGLMGRRGVSMNAPVKFIGFEGDSITAGTGLTPPQRWSWLIDLALSPKIPAWNFAVGGSTVADMTARAAITDSALNPATPMNVLTVWAGANDLAGSGSSPSAFVATLKTYCQARKAAGWTKIIVIPILPRGDIAGFNARKDSANALIAADPSFYDLFATIDATMTNNAAPSNPALYQVDLVHPTAGACSTYLGPNIQTAITTVY